MCIPTLQREGQERLDDQSPLYSIYLHHHMCVKTQHTKALYQHYKILTTTGATILIISPVIHAKETDLFAISKRTSFINNVIFVIT